MSEKYSWLVWPRKKIFCKETYFGLPLGSSMRVKLFIEIRVLYKVCFKENCPKDESLVILQVEKSWFSYVIRTGSHVWVQQVKNSPLPVFFFFKWLSPDISIHTKREKYFVIKSLMYLQNNLKYPILV